MSYNIAQPASTEANRERTAANAGLKEAKQRESVVIEAYSWCKTPFHYGARVKGVGVACGPFLFECHRRSWLGLLTYDIKPLSRDWHFHTKDEKFLEQVQRFAKQVEVPLPGDIALFRLGSKDRPYSHGAIVVCWPHKIIHAHFHIGVVEADATTDILLKTASETTFWSPWSNL